MRRAPSGSDTELAPVEIGTQRAIDGKAITAQILCEAVSEAT